MSSSKIWLVGVNWENIRAGKSLYENSCFASYYEGEDISGITSHDLSKQFYVFRTRCQATKLMNRIIDIQRENDKAGNV